MRPVLAIALLLLTTTTRIRADDAVPAADVLIVPPYLDMIVFDVFNGSPGAAVELYPPSSSEPIGAGAKEVETVRVGSVLTTYVVPRPQPGRWLIRKSHRDARVRIVSQQFFPRGILLRPSPAETVRQHDRVGLTYGLVDGDGQPLRQIPGYALTLEMAIATPEGLRTQMKMAEAAGLGPGVFRSIEESECNLSGRYWTDVKVTTADASGRRHDVFHDRWSGFSAAPAARVDCRFKTSGAIGWLPLRASIACVDAASRAIDLSAMAIGPHTDLFRVKVWRNGRTADATLDLRAAGRGALHGSLRGAGRSGDYRLQLIVDPARLRPAYNVRFVPAEIRFRRNAAMEWIAAGVVAITAAVVLTRRAIRR